MWLLVEPEHGDDFLIDVDRGSKIKAMHSNLVAVYHGAEEIVILKRGRSHKEGLAFLQQMTELIASGDVPVRALMELKPLPDDQFEDERHGDHDREATGAHAW